jgi:Fic family protein
VGSSTRIEGAVLTNSQVEALLSGLHLGTFKSRDEEEVAGYADTMRIVFDAYEHIPISENHVKQLHRDLLKHSTKDARHRGAYKNLPNHLEAFDAAGKSLGIVFETATPFDTPRKMEELVSWYGQARDKEELHELLLTAVFIVHFLAIHPFQDGNGRLSRILTTLILLRAGYHHAPYSSLERIIEENKEAYYLALRRAQETIDGDNSTLHLWITFFLRSMREQISVLEAKLDYQESQIEIPPLSQEILDVAKHSERITVRNLLKITGANRNTIKAHLKQLVAKGLLEQQGKGKGTWYKPRS